MQRMINAQKGRLRRGSRDTPSLDSPTNSARLHLRLLRYLHRYVSTALVESQRERGKRRDAKEKEMREGKQRTRSINIRMSPEALLHPPKPLHTIHSLRLGFAKDKTRKGLLEFGSARSVGHSAQTGTIPVDLARFGVVRCLGGMLSFLLLSRRRSTCSLFSPTRLRRRRRRRRRRSRFLPLRPR